MFPILWLQSYSQNQEHRIANVAKTFQIVSPLDNQDSGNILILPSTAKVLTNKHNDMTVFGRVSEEVNVVANRFRGIAIVTQTVCLARCLDVETSGIDGRCRRYSRSNCQQRRRSNSTNSISFTTYSFG